jgi:hypothetical protein
VTGPELRPEQERGPDGMTRRQLTRHTAWFGSAVVLAVKDSKLA